MESLRIILKCLTKLMKYVTYEVIYADLSCEGNIVTIVVNLNLSQQKFKIKIL